MKHKLLEKFLFLYILFLILASLCFFSIVPSSAYNFLLDRKIEALMKSAKELVKFPEIYAYDFTKKGTKDRTRDILASFSANQNIDIWMVNDEGRILLDCLHNYPLTKSITVPDFSSIASDQPYWLTGTFFDMFSQPTLTVLCPVQKTPHITSHILLHYPLHYIETEKRALIGTCLQVLFVCLLASFIFPVILYWMYYRPFHKILHISEEYAGGNLNTLIPPSGNDEFAQIHRNLNYMAEEIWQSEENQRKLVANISHDFRSPLTSIKGYAEAILDGTIPSESQDKYLEIILTETERLTNLTQNILLSNSLKEGSPFLNRTFFDINALLQTTVDSMEIQCRKKDIHIQLYISSTPQYVDADKEKIHQVIYNLLDNAIKFSYTHSEIHISTEEKRKYIFISIKDFGEGIPANEIPKIWNRFYKSDSSRGKHKKGTGLGLSIVREIIRAHDQKINVVSTKGAGSEFIFTLDKAK